MSLFLVDLEQCPSFYHVDLQMAIEEEIDKAKRIKKLIEDYNETEEQKEEYQDTLEYIKFLNKALEKMEEMMNYDSGIV